jgi:tRNA-specific 2-thiouridylase
MNSTAASASVDGVIELAGDASRDGDWAWVRLEVVAGRIVDARGEGPGVPSLCRLARGRTLLEAAAIPGDALATDALATAIGPHVTAELDERRVAAALSGGVDSAVALLQVRDAGFDPVGVTLRLWLDPKGPAGERACCSPSAVLAARRLCHDLGIPHVTLDLREGFRRAVVGPFVAAYGRGETPNPCIACNGDFRFGELLAFCGRVGARLLATGHYATVVERDGRLLLARSADPIKDQTYMLGRLDPALLPHMWFPLGRQTKQVTRQQAAAAGLAAASRAESQEACFLAGGDYRDFLARHGLPPAEGPVVDLEGRVVGDHNGFWGFTPGQRRGLRVSSAGGPVYAVATDPARNAVVVGPRRALARTRVDVTPGCLYAPAARVDAQLRYRSPAGQATVTVANGGLRLALDEPAYGVAPGQAAVLYEHDAVVGAGLIAATS